MLRRKLLDKKGNFYWREGTMKNRMEIAKTFANKINSKYIQQIILYGSVARGEDNEDSDIDILIITDYYELIEDLISEEVLNVISNENEYISTNIMTKEHYEKTKDFSFLTNIKNEVLFLDEIEEFFKKAENKLNSSKILYDAKDYSNPLSLSYYAMLLVSQALLIIIGISTNKIME